MTGYEIISLVITGVSAFVSALIAIVLGIVSYRVSKKQVETDRKIAEMQKDMDDKNLKASMLEKRMECHEFIHKVFRKVFDISDSSPYYIYHNSSFYELLDKVNFKYDYILEFHLYEGKISGVYSQEITKLSGEIFLKLQEIYDDILLFNFNCEGKEDCDINIDEDMTQLKTKIINCSENIKYDCGKLFELMINEMKV